MLSAFGQPRAAARLGLGAAALVAAGLVVSSAHAGGADRGPAGAPDAFEAKAALAVSQAAIGRKLRDHVLTDRRGRPFRLSSLRGRPVVVSLIYTGCSHTCPMLTRNLDRIVAVARDALGAGSFAVVTIGFDVANDTPQRMAAFARSQGITQPDWWFLSADPRTIAELTDDLGFVYFPSAGGFDHLAQTTVIDGDGRIQSQVYGQNFEAPLLVEPLKALVFGTETPFASVDDLVKKVRLFCTVYDPTSGRYRFDYSLFVGMVIGAISLSGIGFVLVRGWLRTRRRAQRASG